MSEIREPAAKIGTGDFTGRVVSGLVPHAEPGSIVLRQLYPHPPVDIGVIDRIEATAAELTIFPSHRRAWSEADRSALAAFFTTRYRDHRRLAELLGTAEAADD
jgi:hypothetical protein